VVTKNIIVRLKLSGFDVAVFAFFGADVLDVYKGIIIYPRVHGGSPWGEDIWLDHYNHFKADCMVSLMDIYVLNLQEIPVKCPRWIPYTPIDHEPLPPPIANRAKLAYKVLAMSKFAEEQFRKAGIECTYAPHGVDTKVFRPLGEKEKIKKGVGFPEDSFVIGITAMNKGFRKQFDQMFAGFKIFLEQNPDAKKDAILYAHTNIYPPRDSGGFDLWWLAEAFGIRENIEITNFYEWYMGYSDETMARHYNSMDVLLNTTAGEGWGLPITEAQACGVPVIATNFSAMVEQVKGHGWLVGGEKFVTPLAAFQVRPDAYKIADALSEAYNKDSKRKHYGELARQWALKYDWDVIFKKYWLPFFETLEKEVARSKT